MPIENRRFIRFSLDIPAIRRFPDGAFAGTTVQQISVGGCLAEWDDKLTVGDKLRLELELHNGNRLPVNCEVVYRFEGKGIGAKFLDLSPFEQELLAQIISESLEKEDLPVELDPFAMPPSYKPTAENRQSKF